MKKTTVYNLIILDESGSMESIKPQTISGFNETFQTILQARQKFPEQNHLVSLVSFGGVAVKNIMDCLPIEKADQLTPKNYRPNGSTPLFDAMGLSLSKLRHKINTAEEHQVLVTILTDGEENASKEFSGPMIKNMIEELKTLGWVFTFIGANIDVERVAASLSVNNFMKFNQNVRETREMFKKESNARMNFFGRMSKGASKENLADKFFED